MKQKVLILGGTGLVGEEIVKRLAKEESDLTVVSLGSEVDKKSFSRLHERFSDVEHLTGNIFLPTKYKDKTFNELVESDTFLEEYISLLYKKPNHKEFYLYEVVKKTKPDVIIDAINSATVLSYTKSNKLIKDYLEGKEVKLETLLATLSIPRLICFFEVLYQTLKEFSNIKLYLKIGTTGTGGMGFNIPYTHGENKPSFPLLEKAAISGAYTSLLYLLSQTFGIAEIKEVKPASLVGYKEVDFGDIRLGRNNSQTLKVYSFKDCIKIDLKERQTLDFDEFITHNPEKVFQAVFVDTGENGQFSEEEFRTISNSKQMGFITKEEIAEVVLKEINGVSSGKEIIEAYSKAVLGPTKHAQIVRKNVIKKLEELVREKNEPSLAFEVLGPPRLSKLIFEAYILKSNPNFLGKDEWGEIDQQTISKIVSTGIPILNGNKELVFGKKPKIPNYRSKVDEEAIDNWAEEGWVDLRNSNLKKWQARILKYGKSTNYEIGDIVAWIFETEDKGFRK